MNNKKNNRSTWWEDPKVFKVGQQPLIPKRYAIAKEQILIGAGKAAIVKKSYKGDDLKISETSNQLTIKDNTFSVHLSE